MLKAFKYRLNPTEAQSDLLNKHIGSVRFVYNLALETKQMAYAGSKVNISCFDLQKQLPDLKKECEWLNEINSQCLQQAVNNLDKAFTAFFKGNGDFPKYKSKSRGHKSFNVPQKILLKNDKLFIPKFREGIEIVLHRPIKGEIKQATISRTPTGKYFASILCDTGEECKPKPAVTEENTVGIDLGIKDFAITSDGQVFSNPKFLRKAQSKLKYVQRKYSKHKGKRTRHRLAILHEKVANQRKDFLHKVSSELVKNHDSIALENLNVSDLLGNHKLAQAITDASWSTFVSMLEYKAGWRGVNILRIGRFEPSSKLCSYCGAINRELQLEDREWTCRGCGTLHDRDVNAACNIKSFALKNHVCGTQTKNRSELPTLVGVLTSEVSRLAVR